MATPGFHARLPQALSSVDDADLGARRSAQLIGCRVLRAAQETSARRMRDDVKATGGDPCVHRRVAGLDEEFEPCAIPPMAQKHAGRSQLGPGGLAHRSVVVDRRSSAATNPHALRATVTTVSPEPSSAPSDQLDREALNRCARTRRAPPPAGRPTGQRQIGCRCYSFPHTPRHSRTTCGGVRHIHSSPRPG